MDSVVTNLALTITSAGLKITLKMGGISDAFVIILVRLYVALTVPYGKYRFYCGQCCFFDCSNLNISFSSMLSVGGSCIGARSL